MNKTFGKVVASAIHDSVSATSDSLEVRQTVTTIYPGAKASNSKSSALFADDQFGEGQSFDSERVAFIKIPKGTTLPKAKAAIQKIANCGHIYRVMSTKLEDVATTEQLAMISRTDLEDKLTAKDPSTGKPMLFNGKPFFRATFWKNEFTEDIDLRGVTAQPTTAKVVSEEVVEDLAS